MKQIPVWWRTALYVLWLALLTIGIITGIPALAVAAVVMGTLQAGYVIYVAIRSEKVRDYRMRLPSRRQVEIAFWGRIVLYLFWITMIPVAFLIHVPALVVVALIFAALQTVWIVYLAKMRRRSREPP